MSEEYREYKILCASGCGEGYVDVEVYQEGLEDGDNTLYCKSCHGDVWFVIPKEVGFHDPE
jgi:hypothetical protein